MTGAFLKSLTGNIKNIERIEKKLNQKIKIINNAYQNIYQTFGKAFTTVSLFVSRRLKYVHLGLDIPLLSTRVSSELIAIIKDFKKENRDPKYLFIFRRLIHTTK